MEKTISLTIVLTCLFIMGIIIPIQAQETGENRNLFENAGKKQVGADFKPAPDKIETNFGTLNFELEAFPDEASVQKIYDEMDLQRATQAYMDFYPALSVYAIVKSQIRDFKFKSSSDIAVAAGPGWLPSEPFLTGNNSTVYAIASLDLKVDGPTVVEIPPGMYGTANDALAINKAIDACNKAGGGTVFVPSGFYTTGSVHLKSNVTLALDKGAVLKAMPRIMDPRESSLIWGENLRNVKIYGPGTLDGSAFTRSSTVPKGTGDKGIALKLCKNVEIRNLNIRRGGHDAILATGCEALLVDNVTIKTDGNGLNLSQCKDVEVANCHIDAVRYEDGYPAGGGEAIKLHSDRSLDKARPNENIAVRNCYLAGGANVLLFSSKPIAPLRNVRFENIRIVRACKTGTSTTANDVHVIDKIHYAEPIENLNWP